MIVLTIATKEHMKEEKQEDEKKVYNQGQSCEEASLQNKSELLNKLYFNLNLEH